MSQLSYMDKLLDGVEVEWKELGNSITFQRGKRLVKSQLKESGEYAVFQNSMTPLGYYHESNVSAKSAFVICAGAAGEIGFSDDSFWAADDVYYAEQSEFLNSKYLYHFLLTQKHKIASQVRRASIPRLSKSAIEKLIVPIPCPDNPEKSLAIQAEIVRILDAFTAMTAELTAELNLRKKQYNYYREKLLASELPSSKTATLGEIIDMRAGKHIKAKDISAIKNTEHKYTCFGGNGSRGFVQQYSHEGDYALIGRQGALCGNVKRAKGKFYATEHAVVCTPKEEIDIDWAFHMLTFMNLNQYKSQSAQPGLAVGNLANLTIIVPPISEQKKIAKILNQFDTLTTSLQEGLPHEIELRQKQYEYYRDLLLSFPKSNEEEA
ncbi:restriction endonuclease subunit S [Vibrio parahaemolyticus]|nr:restriction endonuclease subunit S [Vibrio parahaemolyticus]EGR2932882.1 restriction endonuclease subunit S [Vibrio parahaemolyticus]EGR2956853.1 restriction endonuclease subunit S [Vibrio parahaemolyticus]EGR2962119.1 restriction endonuclease subunit S [Vibrio parahaemolyticus]EGR2967550.1 restriction endonuclease subunit S [Vibrio parahaemolyticus]